MTESLDDRESKIIAVAAQLELAEFELRRWKTQVDSLTLKLAELGQRRARRLTAVERLRRR